MRQTPTSAGIGNEIMTAATGELIAVLLDGEVDDAGGALLEVPFGHLAQIPLQTFCRQAVGRR